MSNQVGDPEDRFSHNEAHLMTRGQDSDEDKSLNVQCHGLGPSTVTLTGTNRECGDTVNITRFIHE